MRKFLVACLALSLIAGGAFAQITTLTTTFASNNGQSGNMFDLIATNELTICNFEVNLDPGSHDMEVYALPPGAPYLPDVNNPIPWLLIGSALGVVSNGLDVPTPLPIPINVTIPAGGLQAFYVTVSDGGTAINYTNGTAVGALFASDANLSFFEGAGLQYPFTSNFAPRVWNGNINYTLGPSSAGCGLLPYQQNQPGLVSYTINGVETNGFSPAVVSICEGESVNKVLCGTAGFPFEIGATLNTTLVPNFFITPGGQVINVNFLDPSFFTVWGSLTGSAGVWPGVPGSGFNTFRINFTPPVSPPFPIPLTEIDAQLVIADPGSVDGVAISAASCIQISPATPQPGPTGDDASVEVVFQGPPICNPGPIPFYGTSYTNCFVASNGRITFVGPDNDFSPTVAEALTDNPFIGAWSDLSPNVGGTITVFPTPFGIRVEYVAVPYFGTATPNTFNIELLRSGQCAIVGTTGLGAGGGNQFIGVSPGNVAGATDPGPVSFSPPLSVGFTLNGTDMIYEFGPEGSLAPGINIIAFNPNVFGNFDWATM